MISVEKLSYGFLDKYLYKDVSFSLEMGQHCALIGSNGTGKSTLADMIINTDSYLYDGKIIKDKECRIGFVNQFVARDKAKDCSVFDFLSERFVQNQQETAAVCDKMAAAEDMESLFVEYQRLLDEYEAMDGDNYESNIKKQLYIAGMRDLENVELSKLSGGEYKLLLVMREMLVKPNLLIMDEPDVFLDFGNLNRLCRIINDYKGTVLVITHNRYLLNHCFDKVLHLENADILEFDGSYTEYRAALMQKKAAAKLLNAKEQEEIERNEKMVEALRKRATDMANASLGRAVHAKQTQLDRLRKRHIKAPFIEFREPDIKLPEVEAEEEKTVLTISGYNLSFEEKLLENIDFELKSGEKAVIAGENGTGKTTLINDILSNNHPAIHIAENVEYACLSQFQNELFNEEETVYENMERLGFDTREKALEYILEYCLQEDILNQKVSSLSGGEKNILQIAMIALTNAKLLILDEPTSHLDIFAQAALEKAIAEYKGAVLMVSHDFYFICGCADYVLLVEDKGIRRMRIRSFRKLVYEKYFDKDYLEKDKKRQDLETQINIALKDNDLTRLEKLCDELNCL